MALVTRQEAANRLGIWPKTLDHWLQVAGIAYRKNAWNDHHKCITDDELDLLSKMRERPLIETPEQLLARIADLEAEIQRLRHTPGARPQPRQVASTPRARPTPAVTQKLHPRPLPEGWVSFNECSRALGLRVGRQSTGHERSLARAVPPERAPKGEPWGVWREAGNRPRWYDVYAAYTPEQQQRAHAFVRAHWG